MLLTKLSEMQANAANLSTSNRKDLDNIGKQIDYCREYHDRLHEFVITIARNVIADSDTKSRDLDTDSDTLSRDSDTRSRDLDTDSDTFWRDSDTKSRDLDTDSDTSIRVKLNNKQKDVVNFCSVPRSSKEILERVGVSYHTKNIDKYINILVNAGYLEMTNPENPNASNQKYRKKIKK